METIIWSNIDSVTELNNLSVRFVCDILNEFSNSAKLKVKKDDQSGSWMVSVVDNKVEEKPNLSNQDILNKIEDIQDNLEQLRWEIMEKNKNA